MTPHRNPDGEWCHETARVAWPGHPTWSRCSTCSQALPEPIGLLVGTPVDRLRAIVERHAYEVPEGTPLDRMAWHERHARAHADRAELLELLRRIAQGLRDGRPTAMDDCCQFCPSEGFSAEHAPDCPAPALEVLR